MSYQYGAELGNDPYATYFKCLMYTCIIADSSREFGIPMVPFYVSRKNNTMCFLLPNDSPQFSSLIFQVPVPSVLKIHDSVSYAMSTLVDGVPSLNDREKYVYHLISKLRNGTEKNNIHLAIGIHNVSSVFGNSISQELSIQKLITWVGDLKKYKTEIMNKLYYLNPIDN